MGEEFVFYRDDERGDFWHMGLNALVKTSADPDTVAGDPKMAHCSEAWNAIEKITLPDHDVRFAFLCRQAGVVPERGGGLCLINL